MTTKDTFKIYVMGDAGQDTYGWSEEGNRSAPPTVQELPADTARDVVIPSGAGFIAEVLKCFSPVESLNQLSPPDKPPQYRDNSKLLPALPLDRVLTHLKTYGTGDQKADRIDRFVALKLINGHTRNSSAAMTRDYEEFLAEGRINWIDLSLHNDDGRKLLIFHHGARAWNSKLPPAHEKASEAVKPFFEQFSGSDKERLQILVNVKQLPAIASWNSGTPPFPGTPHFQSVFWKELYAAHSRTGIIVSLSALRRAGAAISYGLSWEQTILDFASEMHLFPQLRALLNFRDLFVRIDSEGLLHIQNEKGKHKAELYFEAYAKDRKSRDVEVNGRIVGKNTFILASLACQLDKSNISAVDLGPAVISGLQAGIEMYHHGYSREQFLDSHDGASIEKWVTPVVNTIKTMNSNGKFIRHDITEEVLRGPLNIFKGIRSNWSILDDSLSKKPDSKETIEHAVEIVDKGVSAQLKAPIINFGKLTLIDRGEIEKFSSIKHLLNRYILERQNYEKPISISVFGPPGTGKSFAIKEIAETIDSSHKLIETLEFNLSQFQTTDDLGKAFQRVGSVNNAGKTPLVFFDEFDCSRDEEPLGWLKLFLAPMQDGNFYGAAGTINIGRAIFIFAGSIDTNFDDFKRRASENGKKQKGLDFISRLRGHVDIQAINAENRGDVPFIRRAVVLRGLLEKHNFVRKSSDGVDLAMIDRSVAHAMLSVDRYEHGVRSMEAILQMCLPIDGRIQIGSLPSRAQLEMHANANEFFLKFTQRRNQLFKGDEEEKRKIDDVEFTIDRMSTYLKEQVSSIMHATKQIIGDLRKMVQPPAPPNIDSKWYKELQNNIKLLADSALNESTSKQSGRFNGPDAPNSQDAMASSEFQTSPSEA